VGFLSKLVNKVTGGWAEVDMEVPPEVRRGSSMTITATVGVKSEPIEVERVTVQIQCLEPVPAIDTNLTDGITPPPNHRAVHTDHVHVETAGELPAGTTRTYSATFQLPADVPASDPKHTWMARTVVVMPGNDPDSGWEAFEVS